MWWVESEDIGRTLMNVQARGLRSVWVIALVVVIAVTAAACGAGSSRSKGAESSTSIPAAVAKPVDAAAVKKFVGQLAAVGIGTYDLGEDAPVVPISGTVSPMRLTRWQAENAAAGALGHAGLTVAQVDSLAVAAPLEPGTKPLPASLLLLGWARSAATPTARLAQSLLDNPDLSHPESIVIPAITLTLFASDMALLADQTKNEWVAAHTSAVRVPQRAPTSELAALATWRESTPGLCGVAQGLIDDAINKVFDFIGHIPSADKLLENQQAGGLLDTILHGAVTVGVFLGNGAIDGLKFGIVKLEQSATAPVMSVIASIATVLGIASMIMLAVIPWTGEIYGDPPVTRKAVGNEPGRPGDFTLVASAPGAPFDDWPDEIKSCAEVAKVPLPSLKPHGAKLAWDITHQDPDGLIVRTGDTGNLSDDGTAKLRYETTSESEELHDKGDVRIGIVTPFVTITRTDLDPLKDVIGKAIAANLPFGLTRSSAPRSRQWYSR